MNITIKNDLTANYMVFENVQGFSGRDYAVKILKENEVAGVLPFDHETLNGKTDVLYDISSKEEFAGVFEHRKMGFEDIRKLILSINHLLKNLNGYLLDPDNTVLKKECIYVDRKTEQYEFCYFPYYGGNLMLEMKELGSQLLTMIDYDDRKAVRLAYDIQKKTQTDNFTFEELLSSANQIAAETESYEPERDEPLFVAEEQKAMKESENTFLRKAELYFKENEAGDIFDDINELKIFKKIRNYGAEQPEKGLSGKEKGRKKRKEKREKEPAGRRTDPEEYPKEMLELKEKLLV